MPSFNPKEYFKTYFHNRVFQKEVNSICLVGTLILFVLAGTTQVLESLEDNRS